MSQVGIDNCVGAIDGLLICTEKPSEKFASMMKTGIRAFFCGRKSKFGYNMQVVCDAEGRFLSVWCTSLAIVPVRQRGTVQQGYGKGKNSHFNTYLDQKDYIHI